MDGTLVLEHVERCSAGANGVAAGHVFPAIIDYLSGTAG